MSASLLGIASTFATLSLSAIGGANASLPELRRQIVVVQGLMDDRTFASLVALAQAAPGPNVLTSSAVGWSLAGASGLIVATLAMILPSSALAIVVERLLRLHARRAGVAVLRRSMAPIAVGLMAASGLVLARAAVSGVLTLALAAGMSILCGLTRVNPLFGIAGGAALGAAARALDVHI
ncbi:chromate transporter [Methylocella sp.]|uniref:chromate transporter n=1 Tax=Methylocella sp. TaxID=1978226 RepID=UPI003784F1E1